MSKKVSTLLLLVLLLVTAVAAGAAGAFTEPDVEVIHTLDGDGGAYFGWVAGNLGDLNGDGVNDFITSDISTAGFSGTIYIYSGADGAVLNTITGNPGTYLGYSATNVGDVDGDGINDYGAGAPLGNRVLIVSGATHAILHDISGAGGSFGASVSAAGDLNGDGLGDFLVGASGENNLAGRVYVYSGADGALLRTHEGAAGSRLGTALGKVGDIDDDGVADYVAGARSGGQQGRGEAYAFSGAGGEQLFTMQPVGLPGVTASTFALFFASGAGDVNGDGTPDIFIGDYQASRGGVEYTGRAYVFSGRDGQRIRVMNARERGEGFGPGRGIGDVNNDGHDDLIVGAYLSNAGANQAGRAYVISGKTGQTLRTFTGAIAGDAVGVDALSIGDVNGDGNSDYILTGFGVVYVVAGE